MECNKDEAARAKELAEKRLTEKDIVGAKRIALGALNLFPGLDGLYQLVEIIDIYVAYQKKVHGEVDWYGVLGVEPSADDETIRRQYRKMALSLHPDKNKTVGADGAFKILSEAWSLLSDKVKRAAYDQRQYMMGFSQQKATNGMPLMRTGMNGFHEFTSDPSSVRNPTTATSARPTHGPPPPKPDSFWTSCNHCKIYFEYQKVYLKNYLFCRNCRQPFLAIELPLALVKGKRSQDPWVYHQQQQGVNNAATDVSKASGRKSHCMGTNNFSHVSSSSYLKMQRSFFSIPGGARSASAPTISASEAPLNLRQANEYLKRERENTVSEAAAQGKSNRPKKRRHTDTDKSARKKKEAVKQMAPKSGGCGQGNSCSYQDGSLGRGRTTVSGSKAKNVEDCLLSKLRSMLVKKAQMDIRRKLNEWRISAASKSSPKEDDVKESATAATQLSAASGTKKADNRNMVNNTHTLEQSQKSAVSDAQENFEAKGSEFIKMDVTDPDFHNFDVDRTEESFAENQVWATYDDDDGMPRFYALVRGIISKEPFKIRISWLKSKTNTELGPLDWIDSGFAKTCGEFRVGKQMISEALNSFSHMVRWTKGPRGVINIFPRKGETWALYKNWSSDWNELTPDDVIHKYDMVEVLEDYDEKQGVVVALLTKVAGFKSLFCQHTDSTWTIARQELFRFSHQVPSYLLTGQEAPNAPRGCRELDPASLPSELLQVIQEDKVVTKVEKAENSANTESSEGQRIAEGEQHAVADAFATEDDKGTDDNVNLRFKEPIVTYTRKRTGKKVAGYTDAKKPLV